MAEMTLARRFGRAISGFFGIVLLLVVELAVTMALYTWLNLYHIETFGYLVRLAQPMLDILSGQIVYWLPGSANAAYATLIGELGPKAILLLTMGLVVAAVLRSSVSALRHRSE